MIDQRFSLQSFTKAGLDTELSRRLAEELAAEIQDELDSVLGAAVDRIVSRLNAMGHALVPDGSPAPGEYSYREAERPCECYECGLRVAVDASVSTGFTHLAYADFGTGD